MAASVVHVTTTAPAEGFTIAQAARRLGVQAPTVRQWVRTNSIPVTREGRKVRIPAWFVEWLPTVAIPG